MVTQKQKWRKICSMSCLLQYTLYGKTIEGKTSHKRKAIHKTKNCTCCQSFSDTLADTVMLCKNIDFIFEKFGKREQMQTKTLYNLLIYNNAEYKKDDFSYIVRLQVLIGYVNTRLQRIINMFC